MTGRADRDAIILHASCVAHDGRGLLILGPSGAGKSSLALMLLTLGLDAVADDRTVVHREGDTLVADAPDTIRGLIEARGVGLLRVEPRGPVRLAAAVDLGRVESERMPPRRHMQLLGLSLAVLHKVDSPAFPAAILQYLKAGTVE